MVAEWKQENGHPCSLRHLLRLPGLSTFYNAAQVNGHRLLSYQVAGTTAGAPIFPNVPSFSGASFEVAPSITAFDPNFHKTYQHQANLQVERLADYCRPYGTHGGGHQRRSSASS